MSKREKSFRALAEMSFERMKLILFKPFNLKKWLVLIFIALFAGQLGGGGGNFNLPNGSPDIGEKEASAAETAGQVDPFANDDAMANEDVTTSAALDYADDTIGGPIAEPAPAFWAASALAAFFLVVLIIFFALFFMWFSSRLQFVWYNAVVKNEASVKAPFKEYKKEGNSLFFFNIILTTGFIVYFVLMALMTFFAAQTQGAFAENFVWSFGSGFKVFFVPALIIILSIMVIGIVLNLIMDFIVPVMAMDHCKTLAGLKIVFSLIKESPGDFAKYLLAKLVLGIVIGIVLMLAGLLLIVALFICGAILFDIPYLLIVGLFKATVLYGIFAVVLGVPFLIVAFLLMWAVGLPAAVFFRSFSLYFLTSLKTKYTPIPIDSV